jgi:hypothetical protein
MEERDESTKNMSIFDFRQRFGSNDVCRDYLLNERWAKGFRCPNCGGKDFCIITTRDIYECKCGHQVSSTAGTIMHRSHTPLTKWFLAIYLIQNEENILIHHLKDELEVAYQTAWSMKRKITKNTCPYKKGAMYGWGWLSFSNNGRKTRIDKDNSQDSIEKILEVLSDASL